MGMRQAPAGTVAATVNTSSPEVTGAVTGSSTMPCGRRRSTATF